MRWQDRERSQNVEDRRGQAAPASAGVNLLPLVMMLLRTKFGRIVLFGGVILFFVTGINPLGMLSGGGATSPQQVSPQQQPLKEFVSVILKDTEVYWQQQFAQANARYRLPTLVIFSGATNTACGTGQAAMGPFYCPLDEKVYIDLSFYQQLQNELQAKGDFAQAYVIAHEVGHHVQHVLGISDKVHQAQQRASNKVEANRLSVRLELQADCLAGMWASSSQQLGHLEAGDFEEALVAANAIGDDTLQRNAGGRVVPDSFTHGTSEQRMQWFKTGFNARDDISRCDTFERR